jgi:hypothetical protein
LDFLLDLLTFSFPEFQFNFFPEFLYLYWIPFSYPTLSYFFSCLFLSSFNSYMSFLISLIILIIMLLCSFSGFSYSSLFLVSGIVMLLTFGIVILPSFSILLLFLHWDLCLWGLVTGWKF